MAEQPNIGQPFIVSFSGIDGAGKSTQIESLQASLRQAGIRSQILTFWDDVAVLRNLREYSSHAIFKGDKGVGSPDRPVNRRDKNVRSWYMTGLRFFLYFLDAVSLRFSVMRARRAPAEVIIFDRYLYDELANLPLQNRIARALLRLLLIFAPRPDLAYLFDADPAQAHRRKPEYPLEFVRDNRASYLKLSTLVGAITVIAPSSVCEVKRQVMEGILKKLAPAQREAISRLCDEIGDSPELETQPAFKPIAS